MDSLPPSHLGSPGSVLPPPGQAGMAAGSRDSQAIPLGGSGEPVCLEECLGRAKPRTSRRVNNHYSKYLLDVLHVSGIPVSIFYVTSLLCLKLPWRLRQSRVCLQCGRPRFHPWVEKIPRRRKRQPIPAFLPGRRNL